MLDRHCCTGFSLVGASGRYSLVAVHGLLPVGDSLVSERGLTSLWLTGSGALAQQLRPTGLLVLPMQRVGSTQSRDGSCVSCLSRLILYPSQQGGPRWTILGWWFSNRREM